MTNTLPLLAVHLIVLTGHPILLHRRNPQDFNEWVTSQTGVVQGESVQLVICGFVDSISPSVPFYEGDI